MCKLLQPSFCYFSCNWLAFKLFMQFFIWNSVWVLRYNDSTQLLSVKFIWFLLFLFCHSPGFVLIKQYWDCKFVIKVYFNFLLYFVVFIQIFSYLFMLAIGSCFLCSVSSLSPNKGPNFCLLFSILLCYYHLFQCFLCFLFVIFILRLSFINIYLQKYH